MGSALAEPRDRYTTWVAGVLLSAARAGSRVTTRSTGFAGLEETQWLAPAKVDGRCSLQPCAWFLTDIATKRPPYYEGSLPRARFVPVDVESLADLAACRS
jgi:hypothetical protein